MKNKTVRISILVVLICVFALSAFKIGEYYYSGYKSKKLQQNLIDQAITVQKPNPNSDIPNVPDVPDIPDMPDFSDDPGVWEDIPLKEQAPIIVDFKPLIEMNKDIIGWIYLEGTELNYPIVQAKNNDYYLRRGFDKIWSWPGTPFADYRNEEDFTDFQTTVYGHNMMDGTMFSALIQYKKQAFYDANPVMWLLTPDEVYKVELIAGLKTDDAGIAKLSTVGLENADEFLSQIRKESTFKSKVSATEEDRFLILSTCDYQQEDGRFALIGKLTLIEE